MAVMPMAPVKPIAMTRTVIERKRNEPDDI
jgi:hypothetical protein